MQSINNIVNVERNTCEKCGVTFLTKDKDETKCLSCRIMEEMKLPEDTIINQNVINIYTRGAYDKIKGVDPTYLIVAEGVKLINKKRNNEQLCSKISFIGAKDASKIDKYVNGVRINNSYYASKYDAMVFIKVSIQSKFMVFGISYSDRLYKKLQNEDTLFKKNYAISLAVKWYYKDIIE